MEFRKLLVGLKSVMKQAYVLAKRLLGRLKSSCQLVFMVSTRSRVSGSNSPTGRRAKLRNVDMSNRWRFPIDPKAFGSRVTKEGLSSRLSSSSLDTVAKQESCRIVIGFRLKSRLVKLGAAASSAVGTLSNELVLSTSFVVAVDKRLTGSVEMSLFAQVTIVPPMLLSMLHVVSSPFAVTTRSKLSRRRRRSPRKQIPRP